MCDSVQQIIGIRLLRIQVILITIANLVLTTLHLICLALGRASVKKQDVRNLLELGFSLVCSFDMVGAWIVGLVG